MGLELWDILVDVNLPNLALIQMRNICRYALRVSLLTMSF